MFPSFRLHRARLCSTVVATVLVLASALASATGTVPVPSDTAMPDLVAATFIPLVVGVVGVWIVSAIGIKATLTMVRAVVGMLFRKSARAA